MPISSLKSLRAGEIHPPQLSYKSQSGVVETCNGTCKDIEMAQEALGKLEFSCWSSQFFLGALQFSSDDCVVNATGNATSIAITGRDIKSPCEIGKFGLRLKCKAVSLTSKTELSYVPPNTWKIKFLGMLTTNIAYFYLFIRVTNSATPGHPLQREQLSDACR